MAAAANDIKLEILDERHVDAVIENYKANYGKDEPIKNLLRGMEHAPFMQVYVNLLLPERSSVVAIHKSSGAIAGFMLSQIVQLGVNKLKEAFNVAKQLTNDKALQQKMDILQSYLADLSNNFLEMHSSRRILHMSHLSVSRQHRQCGLSKILISRSEEIAREEGCHFLITEGTSTFSQKSFLRAGLIPVRELPYSTYLYKGAPAFTSCDDVHLSGQLMIKSLKELE